MCSIHLADATAAIVCQNTHHKLTGGEGTFDEANMGIIRRP